MPFCRFYATICPKVGDGMKKKIVIGVFSALMAVTLIGYAVAAVSAYSYEMDPANGVDIFEGVGAFYVALGGICVLLCEADLFHTVYYFLCQPRTKAKSVLNILAGVCWVLYFAGAYLPQAILGYRAVEYGISIVRLEETLMTAAFLLYLLLRLAYWTLSLVQWRKAKRSET